MLATYISALLCLSLPDAQAQTDTQAQMVYITCDDTDSCANTEVSCTGNTDCIVLCTTAGSCAGATIFHQNGHKVNVDCQTDGACTDAKISTAASVQAYGTNALAGAFVTCAAGEFDCNIGCFNELSCANVNVDGSAAKYLNIECAQFESCLDMTLRCPPGSGEPGSGYVPGCTMAGSDMFQAGENQTRAVVHRNLTIYAPNGWIDFSVENYVAYALNSRMICGGNDSYLMPEAQYECAIRYGVWDCEEVISPCRAGQYISHPTDMTFLCGDGSTCDRGLTLECPSYDHLDLTTESQCNLLCVDESSCAGLNFVCNTASDCNVICSGEYACDGLNVTYAGTAGTLAKPWTIVCGMDGNQGSCKSLQVVSPRGQTGDFSLSVHSFGQNALDGAVIVGPSGLNEVKSLYVQCNAASACKGGTFDQWKGADYSQGSPCPDGWCQANLDIACEGGKDACADMTVYCPSYQTLGSTDCRIHGTTKDNNRNMQIYAANGFDNIDVSNWPKGVILDTGNNVMHCGIDPDAFPPRTELGTESCVINEDFFCNCPAVPTEEPTRSPSVAREIHCYGTECANEELVCTDSSECEIFCHDESSCIGATLRNSEETGRLLVYCEADSACESTVMYGVQRLRVNGADTLSGALVSLFPSLPNNHYTVIIECEDERSCADSLIIGTDAYKVNLECTAFEACHDITLHCPPGSEYNAACTIKGSGNNKERVDVHNELVIYAPNGWSSVEFEDYTAYALNGKLICGGAASTLMNSTGDIEYECDIRYGLWDCVDAASPCTDQEWIEHGETFLCDDANRCDQYAPDEPVVCTSDNSQYGQPCALLCVADGSCLDMTFKCNTDRPCHIVCSGDGSCNGLIVDYDGPMDATFDYTLVCGKDGNQGACWNTKVYPPSGLSDYALNVHAFGFGSLQGAVINAPWGNNIDGLNVQCNNDRACRGATFRGDYEPNSFFDNSPVDVQCNGAEDSCADIHLYCSADESHPCAVYGASVDRNVDLQLYAQTGFDQLDVSRWSNAQIVGNENRMHYGANYSESCAIGADVGCDFPLVSYAPTTAEPTPQPTEVEPSVAPSPSPTLLVPTTPVPSAPTAPTTPTTSEPTPQPTEVTPSVAPTTPAPTQPTTPTTAEPTPQPTEVSPSPAPTSFVPTAPTAPTQPTNAPSNEPTLEPTLAPTKEPGTKGSTDDTAIICAAVFGTLGGIALIVAIVFCVKYYTDKQDGYERTDVDTDAEDQ